MEAENPLTGEKISDNELSSLSSLCETKLMLEEEVAEAEKELSDLKAKLRQITEDLIPTKMMELGLSEIKLADGKKVTVSQFYAASIVDQPSFFRWLVETENDGIIKRNIEVTTKKGQGNIADAAAAALQALMIPYTDKKSVHPQTLKSFVREQIESGNKLPDSLKVHIGNKATIK